ncbi:MAG: hypothetical protein WB445_05735 [Acinetobacter sp.]
MPHENIQHAYKKQGTQRAEILDAVQSGCILQRALKHSDEYWLFDISAVWAPEKLPPI